MKKLLVCTAFAAAVLMTSAAQAQRSGRSNINLEPTCDTSGAGMDPRCIGDVGPGNDRRVIRSNRARSKSAVRSKSRAAKKATARRAQDR
jgi:hypothetical protein